MVCFLVAAGLFKLFIIFLRRETNQHFHGVAKLIPDWQEVKALGETWHLLRLLLPG